MELNNLNDIMDNIKATTEARDELIDKAIAELTAMRSTPKGEDPAKLVVTDCTVYPFKECEDVPPNAKKAVAQVTLSDAFLIRGLKVMDGVNGLFVSYPNDPYYKGEDYRSICHPITKQLREHIEEVVLEAYQRAVDV